MKKILKIIGILGVLVVVTSLGVYFFQEKIIFLSETLPQNHSFSFEQPFEEIVLTGPENGKLHGLHFTVENPRGIVVYFHGNAGNLDKWGLVAQQFTKANYEVLMMDYRGYGKSTGKRSEDNLYADANVFYNKAQEWFPEHQIWVHGRSLGTTFATYVAAKNNPKKLVLEAPFYSLTELVKERYPNLPLHKYLTYKFDTASYLDETRCLITIIHGTDDSVVPVKQGDRLYKKIPYRRSKLVRIENGKHNNLNTFQEYWLAMRKELAY